MKSQQRALQVLKNQCNKSISKQQYSFSKQPRFIDYSSRSKTIIDKYYNIKQQKKHGCFFSQSKRLPIQQPKTSPPPNHYNPKLIQSKHSTSFLLGRDQCKLQSMFYTTTLKYPGPGHYQINKLKSSSCIYIGNKFYTRQNVDTPGPIYNISSTLLDKDKILSGYKRKGTIKIVLPIHKNRKEKIYQRGQKKDKQIKLKSLKLEDGIVTYRGNKRIGMSGRNIVIEKQKRFVTQGNKEKSPGPGQYKPFSEFIAEKEEKNN